MKKLLLFGLGCALATSATAQTEKGARFIGANVGDLSYSRKDKNNNFSATLSPALGVFVADNFLLGASLPLSYRRGHSETPFQRYTGRELEAGISPFVRYYLPGAGAHRFFGQLQGAYTRSSNRYKSEGFYTASGGQMVAINEDLGSKGSYSSYGASLGYNYFLKPGVALEVVASYNRYGNGRYSSIYGYNPSGFGGYSSSGAFGISAGFSIFLPSKGTATPAE